MRLNIKPLLFSSPHTFSLFNIRRGNAVVSSGKSTVPDKVCPYSADPSPVSGGCLIRISQRAPLRWTTALAGQIKESSQTDRVGERVRGGKPVKNKQTHNNKL